MTHRDTTDVMVSVADVYADIAGIFTDDQRHAIQGVDHSVTDGAASGTSACGGDRRVPSLQGQL